MSTNGFVSAAWSEGGADGSRTTPCAGDENVGPNTYRYASSVVGWVLIDSMSCGTRTADADHRLRCRPTGDTSELIEENSGRSTVVASGVREIVFSPMTATS
ncbi:MAG: hypothetical protein H0V41_10065 [Pseudonocardiales bacterium]|nr:hypothetical protein [Pseudonocardiales bacterium]